VSAEADRRFMDLALSLGRRGLGRTWPNPAVGAVIVKDGVIVGRGWTQAGGRPHAEVEALRRAGAAARGATLYVTLEPCSHHGKSPPCADAIIAAGIARVVSALEDPNPEVAGAGHARLRAAGIAVDIGIGAEEARRAVGSGVDIVVAQGWEAGGHVPGGVATLPLVPAVVDAVAPLPVIAAGGIGDARGVAAVLALGAQAAWLGTRFLLAEEMPIHEEYRRRLIAAAETDPQRYPNLYSVGWPDSPHRALRNSTADAWQAAGSPPLAQRRLTRRRRIENVSATEATHAASPESLRTATLRPKLRRAIKNTGTHVSAEHNALNERITSAEFRL